MFIGHVALALAAKRVTPRLSLAWLLIASLFADILWPLLVLQGVEVAVVTPGATAFTPIEFLRYPYSHSLLMLAIWGVLLGATYFGLLVGQRVQQEKYLEAIGRRMPANRRSGDMIAAPVIAMLVISHWLLDYVTHPPDLALYPEAPAAYGLGLWDSIAGTIAVELAMFGAASWVYVRAVPARGSKGHWGFISFAVALIAVYIAASLIVPGSARDVAKVTLAVMVLFVVWGWWVDRHRGRSRRRSRHDAGAGA